MISGAAELLRSGNVTHVAVSTSRRSDDNEHIWYILYIFHMISLPGLLRRHRPQMSIVIILRLEKCIIQRHRNDPLHIDILRKLRINIEEHRHIHGLPRIQPLLLEAKALDLGKVGCHLSWCDRVCRHANDVLFGVVGSCVEGERGFAGQYAHLALLGDELPIQHVGDGAVECYADAWVRFDGFETDGGVG
jgi:hypothetical protein